VQERNNHFPNGHTHPTFINTKRVIVRDTKRNPQTIVMANLAFVRALKENADYMLEKTKHMEKDLEDVRQ